MSYLITPQRLLALCANAHPAIVERLAPAFETFRVGFGVTSTQRVCHAMAQFAVESDGFRKLEECLVYSHAERIAAVWPRLGARSAELVDNPRGLANAAYAFKNGNGSESSGDGWNYRGRSPIMLTGESNYAAAQQGIGVPLVTSPDLAADPAVGARIALWFFRERGCNALADEDDADSITRKINGPAMLQATVRRDLARLGKEIFI